MSEQKEKVPVKQGVYAQAPDIQVISVWTEVIPISGNTSALNPHSLSISLFLSRFLRSSWEHSANQVPL